MSKIFYVKEYVKEDNIIEGEIDGALIMEEVGPTADVPTVQINEGIVTVQFGDKYTISMLKSAFVQLRTKRINV